MTSELEVTTLGHISVVKLEKTGKTGYVSLLGKVDQFMHCQKYSTMLVFLLLETLLQHVHG